MPKPMTFIYTSSLYNIVTYCFMCQKKKWTASCDRLLLFIMFNIIIPGKYDTLSALYIVIIIIYST